MRPAAFALSAFAGLAAMASQAAGQSPTALLRLEPQSVQMGMTFDGATIEVVAEIPSGYQAAIRLMGHPHPQELVKLGKKAGLVWMGVGVLHLERVPGVYQVLTSAPLTQVASPTVLAPWSLGYAYLVPDHVLEPTLRAEFVRLKEREGLFAMHEGGLTREAPAAPASPGSPRPPTTELLRGHFQLPAGVHAGDYAVDLIGFRDGRAVHLGSAALHLEYVGAAEALRQLALMHGLLYGIAASVIAIVVGLLTGFLFRPRTDESH